MDNHEDSSVCTGNASENKTKRSTDLCQLDHYKSFSECQSNGQLGISRALNCVLLSVCFLFAGINLRIDSMSKVDREQSDCVALRNALHEIKLLPASSHCSVRGKKVPYNK